MLRRHDLLDFLAGEALGLGDLRGEDLLPHVDDEEGESDGELDQEHGRA